MTLNTEMDGRLLTALRVVIWTLAGAILLTPLIAMRLSDEWNWTASDFVFAAVVLGAACGAIELGVRTAKSWAYLAGLTLAVGMGFVIVWGNAAVGFVDHGPNVANLTFLGVVALAICGGALARLKAGGMARAMALCAVVQAALGVVWRNADPRPVLLLSTILAVAWLVSAGLFRLAAVSSAAASSRTD